MKSFMLILTMLMMIFSGNFAPQQSPPQTSDTLEIAEQIMLGSQAFTDYSIVEKRGFGWSSEGTAIYGFYDNAELRMIECTVYGESGRSQLSFYFNDQTIVKTTHTYFYGHSEDEKNFMITSASFRMEIVCNDGASRVEKNRVLIPLSSERRVDLISELEQLRAALESGEDNIRLY